MIWHLKYNYCSPLQGRRRGNTGAVQVLSSLCGCTKSPNSQFLLPPALLQKTVGMIFFFFKGSIFGIQDWQHCQQKGSAQSQDFVYEKLYLRLEGQLAHICLLWTGLLHKGRYVTHILCEPSTQKKRGFTVFLSSSHFNWFFWQACHNSHMQQSDRRLVSVPTEVSEDLITTELLAAGGILEMRESNYFDLVSSQ